MAKMSSKIRNHVKEYFELHDDQADVIDQAYLDTFAKTAQKVLERSKTGEGKFDSGFGVFNITRDVKTDTANISVEIKKDFSNAIVNGEMVKFFPDNDFLSTFVEIASDLSLGFKETNVAPSFISITAEAFVVYARDHMKEGGVTTLDLPTVGVFTFSFKNEDLKVSFECDEVLKQVVKNFKK